MPKKRLKGFSTKQFLDLGEMIGKLEGKLEGFIEGKQEGKLETARGLILHGVQLDIIAASTGLNRGEIEKLRRDMES